MKTIKEEYEQDFIPAIERMLEKEMEHRDFLETHDPVKYPMVVQFIDNSNKAVEHLIGRLKEYKEYSENLTR